VFTGSKQNQLADGASALMGSLAVWTDCAHTAQQQAARAKLHEITSVSVLSNSPNTTTHAFRERLLLLHQSSAASFAYDQRLIGKEL
jgi:hypothetical protein